MLPLSTVIITLNEENKIRQTIESVKWSDEIVILDSGSTDKTLEICAEYANCKIYKQEFKGFGVQKQKAIGLATNNWVLSIDADEVLDVKLQHEIIELLESGKLHDCKGYFIARTLVFMGKIFNYGRENRMYQLRLFDKNFGNADNETVHAKIELQGETRKLKGQLLHYSFENLHHYFEKFNDYTTQLAISMKLKNRRMSKTKSVVRMPLDFLKLYFVYGNCLNGYPGFVWSCLSTFYRFVKFNKYLEMTGK
jgi:glycosyltransferase involved in cell wall biosynthesis